MHVDNNNFMYEIFINLASGENLIVHLLQGRKIQLM